MPTSKFEVGQYYRWSRWDGNKCKKWARNNFAIIKIVNTDRGGMMDIEAMTDLTDNIFYSELDPNEVDNLERYTETTEEEWLIYKMSKS
jgi:hypothetical protein